MYIKKNKIFISFFALYVVIVFVKLFGVVNIDIAVPIGYSNTAPVSNDLFLYLYTIKRIMNNGWYRVDLSSGFPFGSYLYDYPALDNINYIIIKFLALFNLTFGEIFNANILLVFVINYLLTYFSSRVFLGVRLSILISYVFSLTPYVFNRISEPGLLFIGVIPFVFAVAYKFLIEKQRILPKHFIFCVFVFSLSLYYTIFSSIILVAVFLFNATRNSFKNLVFIGATILIVVVVNNVEIILFWYKFGLPNQGAILRDVSEFNRYALSLIDLFIGYYLGVTPTSNEAKYSYLTIIGIFGFVVLILPDRIVNNTKAAKLKFFLLSTTIVIVILSVQSGFGYFFNLISGGLIRCWNRFFPFLIYAAILYLFATRSFNGRSYSLSAVLILGMLEIGAIQYRDSENDVESFYSDRLFFESLKGYNILQLPHVKFPENGNLFKMTDYNHTKLYLFTNSNKISYGFPETRSSSESRIFNKSTLDFDKTFFDKNNITAIYVDSYGYSDSDFNSIKRKLNSRFHFFKTNSRYYIWIV